MSVVQVARSTHAMGAVVYATYGRGQDAKERNQRAAHVTYFSPDMPNSPEKWCRGGLRYVHGAKTERKNEAFLITQSFSPEEFSADSENDVVDVHGAGMELAARMAPNSPYFIATHTDAKGGHVHNHIVVLNHDFSTGKGAPKELKYHPSVRKANDEVMRDLGMEVTKQDEVHLTPVEAHAQRQGRSIDPVPIGEVTNDTWRQTLRQQVTDLIDDPSVETMDDFFDRALLHNISVRSRDGRGKNKGKKYLTYALVDDDGKPIKVNNRKCSERGSKLGTDFHYEQIQAHLHQKQLQAAAQEEKEQLIESERTEYEEYIAQEEAHSAEIDLDNEEARERFARAAQALQEGEAAVGEGHAKAVRDPAESVAGWADQARRSLSGAENDEGEQRGPESAAERAQRTDQTGRETVPAAEVDGSGPGRAGNHPGGADPQRRDVRTNHLHHAEDAGELGEGRTERLESPDNNAGGNGGNAPAHEDSRGHKDGDRPQAGNNSAHRRTRRRRNEAAYRFQGGVNTTEPEKDDQADFEPEF